MTDETDEEFYRERQERQRVGCPVPPIIGLPARLMPPQSPPVVRAAATLQRPNLTELAKQPGVRFVWQFREPHEPTFSVEIPADTTAGKR